MASQGNDKALRPGAEIRAPAGRGPRPRYSRGLLDETIALWQPFYAARLTDEDAREIIENMAVFVSAMLDTDPRGRSEEICSETD